MLNAGTDVNFNFISCLSNYIFNHYLTIQHNYNIMKVKEGFCCNATMFCYLNFSQFTFSFAYTVSHLLSFYLDLHVLHIP